MGKGPKRGAFSRSRGLEVFNIKFGKSSVENAIKKAISKDKKVRVLEIGCGEGRVLMELRKLFPGIEIHGINKKPWPAMKGAQSLKRAGVFYRIFKPSEINKIRLPNVHFCNAEKLPFRDNHFDVVISQVAIYQMRRKDKVLEEAWRVMKKGGIAFLEVDGRFEKLPDFLDIDTPRFAVYRKGKNVSLKKLAGILRKKGYGIKYRFSCRKEQGIVKRRNHLIFRKNRPRLKLGLEFDEASSFDLRLLNPEEKERSIFWGWRSVYRMK